MATPLDFQIHAGRETTYGTPVAPTRSFEGRGDGHKRRIAHLESVGARAGMQALRSDRSVAVNMGAAGALQVDVLTKGLGMLLRAALGTSAIAQVGATTAWQQTHSTDADGPGGESLTVQLGRPPVGSGSVQPFTFHGGKVTKWTLACDVGGIATFAVDLDYEDADTITALAAAAYPAAATPLAWLHLGVTVGGVSLRNQKLSLSGENNLDVDRRFQRSSSLKSEPLRKGVPSYSGSLAGEFEDLTAYNRFVAGDVVAVVATWTGGLIETGQSFELKATCAAVQFDGDDPEAGFADPARQPMPFRALHNGTDPAVKIEYRSSDNAF